MAAMGRNWRVLVASVAAQGGRLEAGLASAPDQRQVEQHEHGQGEEARTGSPHGEIK